MKTNMDEKILKIFQNLIKSGTKYLTTINYCTRELKYNVKGKEITLCIRAVYPKFIPNTFTTINSFGNRDLWDTWDIPVISENKYITGFKLRIEGRLYSVPNLQRVEYAETLDAIDKLFEEKESSNINSILENITEDSECIDTFE